MSEKLKIFFSTAMCIAISIFYPLIAIAEPSFNALPPRMWVVTPPVSDNASATKLYILGITHLGLSTEYDDYFEKKVKPAFEIADIFIFEGAGGREKEPFPACDPKVLGDEERKIIEAERVKTLKLVIDELEERHIRSQSKDSSNQVTLEDLTFGTKIYIDGLDEFELIGFQNSFANSTAARHPEKKQISESEEALTLNASVVDTLRSSRPNLPVRDLDSKYGIRRAYCSMGKERIKLFVAETQRIDVNSDAALVAAPLKNREIYNILSGSDVVSADFPHPMRSTDKALLCQRNEEWINDIRTSLDGKIHFIAVGVNHLFKVDHEYAHCDGLLTDLKKVGWSVIRVENNPSESDVKRADFIK